jgi:myo-inositol-1(or 4)-monophosphatase
MGELYTATASSPAACNGVAIRVSSVARLQESLVFTGLDKNADPAVPPLRILTRIVQHTQRARIWGSAALDICLVARGEGDGYFETGIYLWDVAAAGLIVRQAGGRVETLARWPGHRMAFLATNGRIHDELRALVALPPTPPEST